MLFEEKEEVTADESAKKQSFLTPCFNSQPLPCVTVGQVYFKFLRGELDASGSDCCDMSGVPGRERGQYSILNVMLPRLYHPPWQGNLLETRCLVSDLIAGSTLYLGSSRHLESCVMVQPVPGMLSCCVCSCICI